jgi:ribosomal protein S18 acetylase RimI-like enzyme
MDFQYTIQTNPDSSELHSFFKKVFDGIPDGEKFSADQDQDLDDWYSIDEMIKYLPYGQLIEVRNDKHNLIGAIFIAKQSPMTWPDGRKMEVFILGVDEKFRGKGIAKNLIRKSEEYAKLQGAKKVIINTHILQEDTQKIYKGLGYTMIGILENYYDNGNAVFFAKTL